MLAAAAGPAAAAAAAAAAADVAPATVAWARPTAAGNTHLGACVPALRQPNASKRASPSPARAASRLRVCRSVSAALAGLRGAESRRTCGAGLPGAGAAAEGPAPTPTRPLRAARKSTPTRSATLPVARHVTPRQHGAVYELGRQFFSSSCRRHTQCNASKRASPRAIIALLAPRGTWRKWEEQVGREWPFLWESEERCMFSNA
eukprot:354306-Chlamydomonas_euryale.AAC.6